MSTKLPTAVATLLLALCGAARAAPPDLGADERKQLESLSPQVAEECVQVALQLDGWRKDVEALRKALAAGMKAPDETDRAFKIADSLAGRSDDFKAAIKYADGVGKRVKQVQAEIDAARYDPDLNADVTADQFRARVTAAARARVAQDLLGDLKPVLDWIDAAKNPARFARDFLTNEIASRVKANATYNVGDVTFRLAQQDFKKSLFSKDAGLVLFVEYKGGVRVKATGLYFRYRDKGQLPEPVFDKARMQVDTSALAAALTGEVLKGLPLNIPAVGPISLKGQPKFGGFDGGKPGTVTFRVAVQFSQLSDVGLSALPDCEGDVTLGADGSAKVTALAVTVPDTVTVPVGPALLMQGGKIEVRPDDKANTITIKTVIVTGAGGKESLSMDVSASFGFPVTKTGVHFKGWLRAAAGQASLGTVEAWLTKDKLKVHLLAPDPESKVAAALPFKLDCTGELSAKGLTAHGTLSALFGAGKADVDLFVGSNGHGSFALSDSIDFGVGKAACSLQGAFRPGFSQLTIDGALTLEVQTEYFDVLQAAVILHGETSPRPLLTGTASVGPVTLTFRSGSFKEVYDALKKSLLDGREKVYDYLAQRERAAGKYGAEREAALRNGISDWAKKNHLDKVSIDGGGPIDKALGQAADDAKKLTGGLAEARDQLGGMASDDVKKLSDTASHFDPGKALGGAFGLRGDVDEPIRVGKVMGLTGGFDHVANDTQADLHKFVQGVAQRQAVNARLNKLAAAVGGVTLHKQQHSRSGEVAELRLRIDRVKAHPDGANDAVVTFFIQTGSFRHKIDPHGGGGKGPATAADGRVGEIHVTGLFGKGPPRAVVKVPKLANQSPWDPEALLRDRLTELVERSLPKTEFAGRFEERKLAVHNATPEALSVWVQVETKTAGGQWSWLPNGRGEDHPAYRFTVPAGKTMSLKHPDSAAIFRGVRARVWAESDSGLVWSKNLRADALLVDEREEDGHYRYYADQMNYYLFTFTADRRARTLHERLLAVRNDTAEPLLVSARAHTRDFEGKAVIDSAGKAVRVEPGKTIRLRHPGGLALRGGSAEVWAEDATGGNFRWVGHKEAAIPLADKDGYRGEAIGTALFVFETKAAAGATTRPSLAGAQATFPLPADQVKLPKVTGLTLKDATDRLKQHGLSATHADGASLTATVTEQDPAPGWVAAGKSVRLTAAAKPGGDKPMKTGGDKPMKPGGDKPVRPMTVKVPAVEGKTFAEAKKLLEDAGLAWKTVNAPENGHVEKAAPTPGTTVGRGDTVTLTFPTRKVPPTPPTPTGGKLAGTWKCSHAGEHVWFKENGVVEVGRPPAGGTAPKVWEKGKFTHDRDVLSLEGGGLKIEGKMRWSGKEKFAVTTGQGKEYTFELLKER
ncbi:MAG TPA: PASTA domain-containing protein [Gemmataceae bacterium]|nr:PASTA domain-containing protein [Gemmataceae bacterium]